jgi:hypothetical protein
MRSLLGRPFGPLYIGEPRGDRLPVPPMSESSEGLDEPASPRPPAGEPSLSPGDRLGFTKVYDRPEEIPVGWPCRLYELNQVVGFRWGTQNGKRQTWRLADGATIAKEVPAGLHFGSHGTQVPDLLEAIWTLDPARVAKLEIPALRPNGRAIEQIPIPLLVAPEGSLQRGTRRAVLAVEAFFESRSWAVGAGGGFYYRGCYFTYIVTDPHWLVAMGLAINAATAITAAPVLDLTTRRNALSAWAALVGEA